MPAAMADNLPPRECDTCRFFTVAAGGQRICGNAVLQVKTPLTPITATEEVTVSGHLHVPVGFGCTLHLPRKVERADNK